MDPSGNPLGHTVGGPWDSWNLLFSLRKGLIPKMGHESGSKQKVSFEKHQENNFDLSLAYRSPKDSQQPGLPACLSSSSSWSWLWCELMLADPAIGSQQEHNIKVVVGKVTVCS